MKTRRFAEANSDISRSAMSMTVGFKFILRAAFAMSEARRSEFPDSVA